MPLSLDNPAANRAEARERRLAKEAALTVANRGAAASKPFLASAGSVYGPRNLSQCKGFSRS